MAALGPRLCAQCPCKLYIATEAATRFNSPRPHTTLAGKGRGGGGGGGPRPGGWARAAGAGAVNVDEGGIEPRLQPSANGTGAGAIGHDGTDEVVHASVHTRVLAVELERGADRARAGLHEGQVLDVVGDLAEVELARAVAEVELALQVAGLQHVVAHLQHHVLRGLRGVHAGDHHVEGVGPRARGGGGRRGGGRGRGGRDGGGRGGGPCAARVEVHVSVVLAPRGVEGARGGAHVHNPAEHVPRRPPRRAEGEHHVGGARARDGGHALARVRHAARVPLPNLSPLVVDALEDAVARHVVVEREGQGAAGCGAGKAADVRNGQLVGPKLPRGCGSGWGGSRRRRRRTRRLDGAAAVVGREEHVVGLLRGVERLVLLGGEEEPTEEVVAALVDAPREGHGHGRPPGGAPSQDAALAAADLVLRQVPAVARGIVGVEDALGEGVEPHGVVHVHGEREARSRRGGDARLLQATELARERRQGRRSLRWAAAGDKGEVVVEGGRGEEGELVLVLEEAAAHEMRLPNLPSGEELHVDEDGALAVHHAGVVKGPVRAEEEVEEVGAAVAEVLVALDPAELVHVEVQRDAVAVPRLLGGHAVHEPVVSNAVHGQVDVVGAAQGGVVQAEDLLLGVELVATVVLERGVHVDVELPVLVRAPGEGNEHVVEVAVERRRVRTALIRGADTKD
mmetsp:Transcript_5946/g.20005  ORF Transcript_5946/g.20005 Transcript_5946/m.20005 type:complete len:682 (+) Transcript_5946:239-2284(+)